MGQTIIEEKKIKRIVSMHFLYSLLVLPSWSEINDDLASTVDPEMSEIIDLELEHSVGKLVLM